MKIIAQNEDFKHQIKNLYKFYKSILFNKIGKEPKFTVEVTSDFKKDYYNECSKREREILDRVGIPELNGVVIMPQTEDLHFIILISSKSFENNQIIHTAIHEFTHLYDYFQYFLENGNLEIRSEEEKESKYYYEFYHWSEYHAKRLGTYFFSILEWHRVSGENPPPDNIYSFQHVEFYTRNIVEKINNSNDALITKSQDSNDIFWDVYQELMSYFGRLSVFQAKDLNKYPDRDFPEELLKEVFGPKIIEMYHLLLRMDSYESAIRNLLEFKKLKALIISKINQRTFFRPNWFDELRWSLLYKEGIMKDDMKFKIPSIEKVTKIQMPELPKFKTVWEDIIPLLKMIARNTDEIKKDLKDIKITFGEMKKKS